MILAVALLAYGVLLGIAGNSYLMSSQWVGERPRAGLISWHVCAGGCLAAVLTGLTLIAHDVNERALSIVLWADQHAVHHAYALGLPTWWWWNLAALAPVGAVVGMIYLASARFAATRRQLHRHRQLVRFAPTARVDMPPDVLLLDDPRPTAFCLRTRRGPRIVVTTAALRALSPTGVRAVVEHERAHLLCRHHLQRSVAHIGGSVLAAVGLMAGYRDAVAALCEQEADDRAARRCGRLTVAQALLDLGDSTPAAPPALGANPGPTALRVERLLATGPSTRPAHRALRWSVVVAGLMPLVIAWQPAFVLIGTG